MRGWCVAHMCSAVELILSRNTVRTCGARCAPETRHHGISWRKLFSLVPGAKHCFLQIRVPNIKCGESWHDQNKHGRDPLQNDVLPLVVGLTCVFLQWSEMYGSSDQSVHNYGSRTTTFIDCARHFVRTLTHAFEAQALTDEMYGARICFARAPLSAQSTEHCENDLSPLVLMNFEILVVCFEFGEDGNWSSGTACLSMPNVLRKFFRGLLCARSPKGSAQARNLFGHLESCVWPSSRIPIGRACERLESDRIFYQLFRTTSTRRTSRAKQGLLRCCCLSSFSRRFLTQLEAGILSTKGRGGA